MAGWSGRSSTTRRAITTGASMPWSTWPPPTRPARRCCGSPGWASFPGFRVAGLPHPDFTGSASRRHMGLFGCRQADPADLGVEDQMGIEARAYANVADVIVVWQSDVIDGCLGFGVQRRDQAGGAPAYLPTFMPFAPDPAAAPDQPSVVHTQPSDVWPIQRYIWADYSAAGLAGVQYQVVPVMGTPADSHADLDQASAWTDPVTPATGSTPGFEMWFTRGIVASPSVTRSVQAIIARETAAG